MYEVEQNRKEMGCDVMFSETHYITTCGDLGKPE